MLGGIFLKKQMCGTLIIVVPCNVNWFLNQDASLKMWFFLSTTSSWLFIQPPKGVLKKTKL